MTSTTQFSLAQRTAIAAFKRFMVQELNASSDANIDLTYYWVMYNSIAHSPSAKVVAFFLGKDRMARWAGKIPTRIKREVLVEECENIYEAILLSSIMLKIGWYPTPEMKEALEIISGRNN